MSPPKNPIIKMNLKTLNDKSGAYLLERSPRGGIGKIVDRKFIDSGLRTTLGSPNVKLKTFENIMVKPAKRNKNSKENQN